MKLSMFQVKQNILEITLMSASGSKHFKDKGSHNKWLLFHPFIHVIYGLST